MGPHLLFLCVEVEQFVFQEVGVEGHKWAGRGGDRCDYDPVRARLWKNTGDATPSQGGDTAAMKSPAIAFVSPST